MKSNMKINIAKAFDNINNKDYLKRQYPKKIRVDLPEKIDYDAIDDVLMTHSYDLVKNEGGFKVFSGHGVKLVAFEPKTDSCFSGYLFLDHLNAFDKVTKCPSSLKFPIDSDELFKSIKQIGSPSGYLISHTYSYIGNNPFTNDFNG